MPRRFLQISFTSPTRFVEKTLTVEDTLAVMAEHVPASQLDEPLLSWEWIEWARVTTRAATGRSPSELLTVASIA
jgi:hypothetical protein